MLPQLQLLDHLCRNLPDNDSFLAYTRQYLSHLLAASIIEALRTGLVKPRRTVLSDMLASH